MIVGGGESECSAKGIHRGHDRCYVTNGVVPCLQECRAEEK